MLVLSIVSALVVAAIVACAMEAANRLLGGSEYFGRRPMIHVATAAVAVLAGAIIYFAPRTANMPWIAAFMLGCALGIDAILAIWWHEEGSNLRELVPFWILAVMFYFVAKSAAEMAALMATNAFPASVIKAIPAPAAIITVGHCIADLLRTRGKLAEIGSGPIEPEPPEDETN